MLNGIGDEFVDTNRRCSLQPCKIWQQGQIRPSEDPPPVERLSGGSRGVPNEVRLGIGSLSYDMEGKC